MTEGGAAPAAAPTRYTPQSKTVRLKAAPVGFTDIPRPGSTLMLRPAIALLVAVRWEIRATLPIGASLGGENDLLRRSG